MKKLYYLKPESYYYNYAIEGTCRLSLAFPKGLYCKAYSLKQAVIYLKRRIAVHDLCTPYDIDISPNDLVIEDIGENNE